MTDKQRAYLKAAIAELDAMPDNERPERYRYYADETRSFWSVTQAALIDLGDMLAAGKHPGTAYDKWAEGDDTAIECKRRR